MRLSKELFISAMAGLIMLFSAPAFATCTLREAEVAGELLPSTFPLSSSLSQTFRSVPLFMTPAWNQVKLRKDVMVIPFGYVEAISH